jgi:hypothetical protein
MKGPGFSGDFACEVCELAEGGETAVENPGDERPSDEDEEKHASAVELNGSVDGMPDVLGRRSIDNGDEPKMSATNLAGIDDARTGKTEKTVALVSEVRLEEAV